MVQQNPHLSMYSKNSVIRTSINSYRYTYNLVYIFLYSNESARHNLVVLKLTMYGIIKYKISKKYKIIKILKEYKRNKINEYTHTVSICASMITDIKKLSKILTIEDSFIIRKFFSPNTSVFLSMRIREIFICYTFDRLIIIKRNIDICKNK